METLTLTMERGRQGSHKVVRHHVVRHHVVRHHVVRHHVVRHHVVTGRSEVIMAWVAVAGSGGEGDGAPLDSDRRRSHFLGSSVVRSPC